MNAVRTAAIKSIMEKFRANPVAGFTLATALSQIFPLISAPVLSRLYSPEAFGSYAIYFALSTILGTLAIFSLQNAIVLEAEDSAALEAGCVALVPPAVVSALLLFILLCVPSVADLDFLSGLGHLILLVPVTIFLSSAYLIGYSWLLRRGYYRLLAVNKITLAFATMTVQIGIGFLQLEALGLIVANMIGYILAGVLVYRCVWKEEARSLRFPSLERVIVVLKKNNALVRFTTPASLLNSACSYLPDFFVARLFGTQILGQYSLGMRMVSMPLAFVSSTVQDVFKRDVAREWTEVGNCRRAFSKYFWLMAAIAVFVLMPLIGLLPLIFEVVFGAVWARSGLFIQCLAFFLVVRFVSSPLSYVWIVAGKQRFDMLWQIGLLIIASASLTIPKLYVVGLSAEKQFFIYGMTVGSWYGFALFMSFYWSRSK